MSVTSPIDDGDAGRPAARRSRRSRRPPRGPACSTRRAASRAGPAARAGGSSAGSACATRSSCSIRSRDAASDACRRTSSATCSAGAACAASESSSRLSSVEYCWSESRGPRLSVPISSPPRDERHHQRDPRLPERRRRPASRARACSTSTAPPAVWRYATSGSFGAISTAGAVSPRARDLLDGRRVGDDGHVRRPASADHPPHALRDGRHLTPFLRRHRHGIVTGSFRCGARPTRGSAASSRCTTRFEVAAQRRPARPARAGARRTRPASAPRRSGAGRSAGRRTAGRASAAGRNSAATTSVEPAIARFDPPAKDENSACPASTSPM